jgi:hypothetical protein
MPLLLLMCIAGQAVAQASARAKKKEKAFWFFESALRLAGDAEMAFVGPALSMGGGVLLNRRWSFSTSYTFFRDTYRHDGGQEYFRNHTIDFVPVFHFRSPFDMGKGFFIGAGLCWQSRRASHVLLRPEYVTGAYTLGYQFPVEINSRMRSLAIDWRGFGPYREAWSAEVFTQFMLGVRFRY